MGYGSGVGIVDGIRFGIGAATLASNYLRYSTSKTQQKRKRTKQVYTMDGSTTLRRERRRIGRKRRRTAGTVFREVLHGKTKVVFRWQNISDSILGPGRVAIQWSDKDTTDFDRMPIHFMSVSQFPWGTPNGAKGCRTDGMKRYEYSPLTGTWVYFMLNSQDNLGTNGGTSEWYKESATNADSLKNVFHAWTQINLNLYGTRCVPITYTVYLMSMPEQIDPQSVNPGLPGATLGSELNNMLKDIARPICGNVLSMNGRQDWQKDVKVVRKFVRTIQPLPFSDQTAVGSSLSKTAHVQQLKVFLRHDRSRNYKWSQNLDDTTMATNLSLPGWDEETVSDPMSDCEWGKKLYLFITATSPRVMAAENGDADFLENDAFGTFITDTQGSYDICVRSCFYGDNA